MEPFDSSSWSTNERKAASYSIARSKDGRKDLNEWKNPWAWAGFTTHDGQRCQSRARIPALIYNWGTIFMRLGIPDQHAEAVTSRPLALYGIAT